MAVPSTAVFDPNVFDFSTFDTTDLVPTLYKVEVMREFRKVSEGQDVPITIWIQDSTTTPGRRFFFNPSKPPEVEIRGPDGSIIVPFTVMRNTGLGTYTYIYTHWVSEIFDFLTFHSTVFDISTPVTTYGIYTGRFQCINGNSQMHSKSMVLFEVSPPGFDI
jgi:hypothetical protein